jgi:anti-sigma B factor antagonist
MADRPFNTRVERRDEDTIVYVSGDVDLRSSPALRTELLNLLKSPPRRLIVDLTGVDYMDSSGVGTVVELKRLLERKGGKLVLCGLQERVRGVFEITQLDKFFTIFATCAEARK